MPIPYAVIGTGWITDSWITAAAKTSQWQLSAVYSRTQDSAQAFASKHNCPTTHTSLDSLAVDSSISAVYIASPNDCHYAQAKQMLQARKHVILEKPATSTPKELAELFEIAKTQSVFLLEAYRHIHEYNFRLLHSLLNSDKLLGPIYGASLTYASYSSRYNNVLAGEEPNIFSLQHSGGSLVDIGVYPITFAIALFGAPKSQLYVPFITRTGVDGGGVIILQYEGFGVQINQSKGYHSFAPCEIYGENGTMSVNATADISSLKHWSPRQKTNEEMAGSKREAKAPNVNMEEEAEEFARIIGKGDKEAAAKLENISKDVVAVTSELRRQNGVLYPADKA